MNVWVPEERVRRSWMLITAGWPMAIVRIRSRSSSGSSRSISRLTLLVKIPHALHKI